MNCCNEAFYRLDVKLVILNSVKVLYWNVKAVKRQKLYTSAIMQIKLLLKVIIVLIQE